MEDATCSSSPVRRVDLFSRELPLLLLSGSRVFAPWIPAAPLTMYCWSSPPVSSSGLYPNSFSKLASVICALSRKAAILLVVGFNCLSYLPDEIVVASTGILPPSAIRSISEFPAAVLLFTPSDRADALPGQHH